MEWRRAAAAEVEADVIPKSSNSPLNLKFLSYSEQYDRLFSQPIDAKKPVPKPSKDAQQQEDHSKKVLLSDVHSTQKTRLFTKRSWEPTDLAYAGSDVVIFLHAYSSDISTLIMHAGLAVGNFLKFPFPFD